MNPRHLTISDKLLTKSYVVMTTFSGGTGKLWTVQSNIHPQPTLTMKIFPVSPQPKIPRTVSRFQAGAIKCLLLPMVLMSAPGGLQAQADATSEDSEDVVCLSPFCVSSSEDRGYVMNTLAGTRIAQPRFGSDNNGGVPSVPITLIRRADAVVIEFALSNSADKQDLRNKELTDSVDALAKEIKTIPGLRFENREVQLMSGNRSRSIIGKGGVVTSFANFAVFADINAETRLYERVKQVRGLVSAAKLIGNTKTIDGPVGLFIKRPNEMRKELLAKIFEDLELVKKGLGTDFEVLVSGLAKPVQLRSCSENEVELWLDYSFTIRSIRDLEAKKIKAG